MTLAKTLLASVLLLTVAAAQELEPRAYSPSPVGTNFLVVGFQHTAGDVVFDPTVPITDAEANVQGAFAGYGRTFGLFGRQAQVAAALPYAWGDMQGNVGEQSHSITRSGLGDLRFRASLILRGSPALSPAEFAKRRQRFLVGVSLAVAAPSGQYGSTKLINLGTNRWAFKPEVGISYPVKKFNLDFYAGAWFFTTNPAFFPGPSTRAQDPVITLQAHGSYSIRPRMWVAADATWYEGGASHIDDGPATGRLNGTRIGTTVSVPLSKRQSLKFAYSRGLIVRSGGSFDTLSLAWQLVWFDSRKKQP